MGGGKLTALGRQNCHGRFPTIRTLFQGRSVLTTGLVEAMRGDLTPGGSHLMVVARSSRGAAMEASAPRRWATIEAYLRQGAEDVRAGDWRAASRAFQKALQLSPRLPEAVGSWRWLDRQSCMAKDWAQLALERQRQYQSVRRTFDAVMAGPAAPSRIPKLIHRVWHAWDSAQLPTHLAAFASGWQAMHPGWEHRIWGDDESRALIAQHYPWFLATYDGYPDRVQRVDAVRYFILDRYGGLYVDVDAQSMASIEPMLGKLQQHAGAAKVAAFVQSPESHAAAFCRGALRPGCLRFPFFRCATDRGGTCCVCRDDGRDELHDIRTWPSNVAIPAPSLTGEGSLASARVDGPAPLDRCAAITAKRCQSGCDSGHSGGSLPARPVANVDAFASGVREARRCVTSSTKGCLHGVHRALVWELVEI